MPWLQCGHPVVGLRPTLCEFQYLQNSSQTMAQNITYSP